MFFSPIIAAAALLVALAATVNAQEVIVDNTDAGFQKVSGFWFASSNSGYYGTNSLITDVGGSEQRVRWTAQLPADGEYDVFAWWVASSNRATDAPYEIITPLGPSTVTANQTANSAQWNHLGTFTLNQGTASVELTNQAASGTYVSADAIRWVFLRPTDPIEPCAAEPTTIPSLGGSGNCFGLDLPGAPEPHPGAKWTIHSDLPELFSSTGVLYSTRAVLPPDAGNTVPLALRTQTTTSGFTTIDDDFDLFLFHITQPGDGSAPRRIVVYVQNDGPQAVTIRPRQVIVTQGLIGNIHEMESNLGRRWMEENLDTRYDTVTIPAGGGAPVGYSNNFGGFGATIDANVNCFGMLRADVLNADANTNLVVSVVAIPSGNTSGIAASAASLLNVAATSADGVPITTTPGAFELRRAVGVFPNFQWRGEAVTLDAAALTPSGVSLQMALSQIQAFSCPAGRQTVPMVRHPGFAHGDTIGNYMVDYRVQFHLVNRSPSDAKAFDITFGRSGADIGLAWRVASSTSPLSDADVDAATVSTAWAGPSQADAQLFDSLLDPVGGPITLPPCGERYVAVRFTVLGNSSLPFAIKVVPAAPAALPPTVWVVR